MRWGIIQHVATRDKLRFQASGDSALAVADVIEFIRIHSAEGEVSLPFTLNGSETPEAVDGTAEVRKAGEPQDKSEAGTSESQP